MKNLPTLLAAVFVALVLLAYMCTFEVRSTEVAIVKTAGRPADEAITEPGLNYKWPWPIQSVVKYDKRIRILSDKTEETGTRDEKNLILSSYTAWRIVDPSKFHENFPNEEDGVRSLRTLIRSRKNDEVGTRRLAEFVSVHKHERRLDDIEESILKAIRVLPKDEDGPEVLIEDEYGIEVLGFGIKKLALPEAVTAEIFASMKAAQQAKAQRYIGEGDSKAKDIIATAHATEQRILAAAQSKVAEIDAESHRIVGEYYKRFNQYPELQIFLDKLKSNINALKARSTIILDTSGPPFDLFQEDFMRPAGDSSAESSPPAEDAENSEAALVRSANNE